MVDISVLLEIGDVGLRLTEAVLSIDPVASRERSGVDRHSSPKMTMMVDRQPFRGYVTIYVTARPGNIARDNLNLRPLGPEPSKVLNSA